MPIHILPIIGTKHKKLVRMSTCFAVSIGVAMYPLYGKHKKIGKAQQKWFVTKKKKKLLFDGKFISFLYKMIVSLVEDRVYITLAVLLVWCLS